MAYDLVVIGASLGGLEALQRLLSQLHAAENHSFGAAVVIVQHRRAENNSPLAELLQGVTHLRVTEVCDHQPIAAGEIYLGPPDYHVLVDRSMLYLSTEAPVNYARPSIDVLFESAAEAYGDQVLAVVLTGSSDDGALGAAKIVARGGMLLVQDPDSAASPVAPSAVLACTRADHVGEPEALGRIVMQSCSVATHVGAPGE